MGPAFVETLPVGRFHGIGPATSAKMNSLGLHTGLDDMRNQSLAFMQACSHRMSGCVTSGIATRSAETASMFSRPGSFARVCMRPT
jgi:IMS family HHH motif